MEFIATKNLGKVFHLGGNTLEVLQDVNLTINKGEVLMISGISGVGKSTLMHVLGGLDRPTSGDVFFENTSVFNHNDRKLARFRNQFIGFVFQFYYLLPEFTALENVMMPMWIRAGRTRDFRREGMQLLEQVGIANRAGHKPAQLSGGEQQRLAIARSLANHAPRSRVAPRAR